MSDNLTGQKPKDTFGRLLQIANANDGADGTLRTVRDGKGDATALSLSTTEGNLVVKPAGRTVPRGIKERFGEVFNVMDFGVAGDGVTADSEKIQAAANALPAAGGVLYFPPGLTFKINSTIFLPYGTKVHAHGARFTTVPVEEWISPLYFGIHLCFTSPTFGEDGIVRDGNYALYGGVFDFSNNGLVSQWSMWYIRNSVVRDVHFIGGQTQCQHVRTENTVVESCTFEGWQNAACDHFDSPKNARVSKCLFKSTIINGLYGSQSVTFNAVPVVDRPQIGLADGLVLEGCQFESDNPNATPNQIEPLGEGATARNVAIYGNKFTNQYLVCRGDCQNFNVFSNQFNDVTNRQAIQVGRREIAGDLPDSITIISNDVVNPIGTTASGIIQCDATNWTMALNRVIGSNHGSSPSFRAVESQGVFFGNQYSNAAASVTLSDVGTIGFNIANNRNLGFYDTQGTRTRFFAQGSDDNFIFASTDAAGATRPVWSIFMRSDVSEFSTLVPVVITDTMRLAVATVAAAGTNLAGATTLTRNITNVTTCTTGVADGVRLAVSNGREQTIVNSAADTLKVYPNSASAGIDAGGLGVFVTIAPGKSKTFTQVATGNFRTTAAT